MAMILPSFVLTGNSCTSEPTSGMDAVDKCYDPVHWKQYPYVVNYQYNSRGYRDHEWPDQLDQAVWCFGESFTMGIGLPFEHTWPRLLGGLLQQPAVNISLDGASNQWILRKIQELTAEIIPRTIVIQWTFTHRRETTQYELMDIVANRARAEWEDLYSVIKDTSWPDASLDQIDQLPQWIIDEIRTVHVTDGRLDQWLQALDPAQWYLHDKDRRLQSSNSTYDEDADDLIQCVDAVEDLAALHGITVIHSFVPYFSHSSISDRIIKRFETLQDRTLLPFKPLDLARDGFHYGVITSAKISQQMCMLIQAAHAKT